MVTPAATPAATPVPILCLYTHPLSLPLLPVSTTPCLCTRCPLSLPCTIHFRHTLHGLCILGCAATGACSIEKLAISKLIAPMLK